MTNDCDVCYNLRPLGYMNLSPQSIADSARKRECDDCKLLLLALRKFDSILFSGQDQSLDGFDEFNLPFMFPWPKDRFQAAEFYIMHGDDVKRRRIHSMRNISGSTGGPLAFEWACKRLQQCLDSHKACTFPSTTPLPTRILDLKGPNGAVQLYISKGESEDYVCLSHSWGGSVACQTLRSNIEKQQQGIELGALPITFRDAVNYVRKLGFRYLWIDSLCIVQDDVDDWRRESVKMCDVYRNAKLTVAATKSRDSHAGLFAEAAPQFLGYHVGDIDVIFDEGLPTEYKETCRLFLRQSLFETHDGFHRHIYDDSFQLPLLKRGWVFQERLLSPRILHFGPQEIAWECAESSFCECREATDSVSTLKTEHSQNMPGCRWWQELIKDYSALQLTFPSDKLPALSGIASVFLSHRGQDRYIAGMWESSIVVDLLWRVKRSKRAERLEKWRGPSWSWVSAPSAVYYETDVWFGEKERLFLCEILNIDCVTVDDNPTSEVNSASLKIRGCLQEVTIQVLEEFESSLHYGILLPLRDEAIPFWSDYHLHAIAEAHTEANSALFRLPLCRDWNGLHCLIIRRSSQEAGHFERIGISIDPSVTSSELEIIKQSATESVIIY